jgi:hypothetical protein
VGEDGLGQRGRDPQDELRDREDGGRGVVHWGGIKTWRRCCLASVL